MISLYNSDCLEQMQSIEPCSIDMILCDLPYGTTACPWDTIIPFDKLWEQYNRIIKDKSAIVLFGSQPFTSKLILSNLEMFKYEIIWEKSRGSNFMHSKFMPLKVHENIIVFSKSPSAYNSKSNYMNYYPQMVKGKPYDKGTIINDAKHLTGKVKEYNGVNKSGNRYPRDVIYFSSDSDGNDRGLHPTQKPVKLLEYLINTYTKEGDLVLDNCMGSGSSGIACLKTNRNFIGIEKEQKYFNIAKERIENFESLMMKDW
jgi:site-specific DNA-methyltransferase (adenine-specific)